MRPELDPQRAATKRARRAWSPSFIAGIVMVSVVLLVGLIAAVWTP